MTWLPFDLHPEIPSAGVPMPERFRSSLERFRTMTGEAGLPFEPPARIPRTMDALTATEWVRNHAPNELDRFHRDVFAAYWASGRDIGDRDVLRDIAGVELPDAAFGAGEPYLAVQASTERALDHGVTGTPAWLVDGRFVVPGCQTREAFDRILERF